MTVGWWWWVRVGNGVVAQAEAPSQTEHNKQRNKFEDLMGL